MKLVVISPEHDDPRETTVLGELFAAGLERYHVRKPAWSRSRLEAWLHTLPHTWRPRLVLHQHHELVAELELGGVHFRDEVGRVVPNAPSQRSRMAEERRVKDNAPCLTSRSCHDLGTLRAALGHYDSVFFSPVFPSLSKPGHGEHADFPSDELVALLAARTPAKRRTSILALGGVTPARMPAVRALGFDGAAVLGAIWLAADPVAAFCELQEALCCHAT